MAHEDRLAQIEKDLHELQQIVEDLKEIALLDQEILEVQRELYVKTYELLKVRTTKF